MQAIDHTAALLGRYASILSMREQTPPAAIGSLDTHVLINLRSCGHGGRVCELWRGRAFHASWRWAWDLLFGVGLVGLKQEIRLVDRK